MKLKRIELRDFKCYEKLDLSFKDTNGLFLLTGENHQNMSLGTNGVGKSTILDAICWALYEKTAKGIKASKLLRRGTQAEGYVVKLHFDEFEIERSWHPNYVTLNGKVVSEEQLVQKIGLTYEQFLFTIYFQQNSTHFVDLSATEKLAFLSDVFDLNIWLDHAEVCKAQVDSLQIVSASLLSKAEVVSLHIADLVAETERIQMLKENWEQERLGQRKVIETNLEEITNQMNKWESDAFAKRAEKVKQLDQLKAQVKEVDCKGLEESAELVRQAVEQTKNQLDTQVKLSNQKQLELMSIKTTISNKTEQISNLQSIAQCPTCEQVVSDDHKSMLLTQINEQIKVLDSETKTINEQITAYAIVTTEKTQLLQDLYDKNSRLLTMLGDAKAEQEKQNSINQQINEIEQNLSAVQEGNPYTTQHAQLVAQLSQFDVTFANPYDPELVKIAEKHENEKTKHTEFIEAKRVNDEVLGKYMFWKTQFPLIRLAILDDITEDIEIHFNQALAAVGLFDWSVKVATDRALKSNKKAVRKELNIQLFNNQGVEIEIDTISGGEMQRIRIASAIGISEMIKARLGVNWNLQLWDEPSLGLSGEGISNMLEFFKMLSESVEVFVADHRVQNLVKFDKIFNIIKRPTGCSTIDEIVNEVDSMAHTDNMSIKELQKLTMQ